MGSATKLCIRTASSMQLYAQVGNLYATVGNLDVKIFYATVGNLYA